LTASFVVSSFLSILVVHVICALSWQNLSSDIPADVQGEASSAEPARSLSLATVVLGGYYRLYSTLLLHPLTPFFLTGRSRSFLINGEKKEDE
jgi:hypothetical protein